MGGKPSAFTARGCYLQSCTEMCVVCSSDWERRIDNKATRFAEDRKCRTDFTASQRNLTMLRDQKPEGSTTMQEKKQLQLCMCSNQPDISRHHSEQRRLCLSGELWRTSAQLTAGGTIRRNQGETQHPVLPFGIGSCHPLQKGTGEAERVTGQMAGGTGHRLRNWAPSCQRQFWGDTKVLQRNHRSY